MLAFLTLSIVETKRALLAYPKFVTKNAESKGQKWAIKNGGGVGKTVKGQLREE